MVESAFTGRARDFLARGRVCADKKRRQRVALPDGGVDGMAETNDNHDRAEEAPEQEAAALPGQPPREATFLQFLYGMHLQALMHLGHVPNPIEGEAKTDLANARYSIDLLGVLQEKTKGNLTEEEEAYLRSSLYELRMAYVEVVKAAAAEPAAEADGGTTDEPGTDQTDSEHGKVLS
jgi:hypothetical protein